jgi:hypothetical protein
MELNGLSQMRKKIFRAVASRIKMKLMWDLLREQLLMHLLGGGCESVFILLPAINVERLTLQL